MYEGHTVGVVVPAYNEEGFVGEVLETLPPYVDRAYVVDDRSTDGTWAEIQATASRINDPPFEREDPSLADGGFDRRIVPIRHDTNRGVGGAIKTGYLRAEGDGVDVTAVMGGDGQMDPDELDKLLDPIVNGEADYAKGNRLLHTDDRAEMPGFRYVGNVMLSYLTKIASGYWYVGDPQNGYTAISADALSGVGIEDMFEFYGYCNDLLVRLSAHEYRVVDVPIAARYRDEESDIDYRTYVPLVSWMLLRTCLWRLAVRRETGAEVARSGLYVGGAIGLLVGVGSGLRSLLASLRGLEADSGVTDPDAADADSPDAVVGPEDRAVPDRDARTDRRTARTERATRTRRGTRGGWLVVGVLLLVCAMVVDAISNRSLNETLK